jgi:STE24 endopeptidase
MFGLSSLNDLAALPVILIYFILFGVITQPLEAFISRSFERSADSLALETTGLKEAFISTMDKLAKQNLSDRNPHPIIKFFFFDHPPIDERIKMAQNY